MNHRVHIFTRDEIYRVSVSAHSAGAYTATLLVMVNVMKGGGRAPPTLTSRGQVYPHDAMYARKRSLLLCVLCGMNCTQRCREITKDSPLFSVAHGLF
jgi:hypothetical protein